MDFELSQEHQALKQKAREFVEKECLPLEATLPLETEDYPAEVMRDLELKLLEWGLTSLSTPKEHGGQGVGLLGKSLVVEELGKSWALVPHKVLRNVTLDLPPILWEATDYQRQKYLYPTIKKERSFDIALSEPGAGSDFAAIQTTAARDGDNYVLNGLKRWTEATATPDDFTMVFAYTAPGKGAKGISCFLVDNDTPGFEHIRTLETMSPGFLGKCCDLALENCVIPTTNLLGKEGEGFHYAMHLLNENRFGIAATMLGMTQRCFEVAMEYAKERITFGKPIAEHQAIQWFIADSAIDLHMARLMLYHGAWKHDQGEDVRLETAMLKSFLPDMACRVTDRAIQICGGVGLLKEMRLEGAYRQARVTKIAEGSTEIMHIIISRCMLEGWPLAFC